MLDLYFFLQADEEKLQQLIQSTTDFPTIGLRPNFNYLWYWQVKYVEQAMAFSEDGNSSKTLDFLLFCNDTSAVNDDNMEEEVIPIIEYTTAATEDFKTDNMTKYSSGEPTTTASTTNLYNNSTLFIDKMASMSKTGK